MIRKMHNKIMITTITNLLNYLVVPDQIRFESDNAVHLFFADLIARNRCMLSGVHHYPLKYFIKVIWTYVH